MRRTLTLSCEDATLAATLDDAPGTAGLLIVSGGNEIRVGAHRGMAKLATDISAAGFPVLRFDRRGVGDSEGENGGFESSAPDIAAAAARFRAKCPAVETIVAFGNCDAASALLLHRTPGIDALILANPWTIETADEMPPPAAIRARYKEKLRDPAEWRRLLTGAVNLRKLLGGLGRIAAPTTPSALPARIAEGLAAFSGPVLIILAERDNTAIAFLDAWQSPVFARARGRAGIELRRLDSASHSFAGEADYDALKSVILDAFGA